MKPRVMSLVVFTALVGLFVAPGHLDPLIGFVALLCIAAGAGAAGALNMWYDADIDALMARTAMRPIPRGRVSRDFLAAGLKSLTAIASMMVDPASIPKRWRGSGGIRGSGSRLVNCSLRSTAGSPKASTCLI